MISPGWNCASCLVFNGEEKEPLHVCRSCGAPRKTFGLPLEEVMRHMRTLEENLTATQQRCTELVQENRTFLGTIASLRAQLALACENLHAENQRAEKYRVDAERLAAALTAAVVFGPSMPSTEHCGAVEDGCFWFVEGRCSCACCVKHETP